MTKYIKSITKYFTKHIEYNSAVHVLIGIGIGALLTYPVAGSHPVRFGVVFLVLGILGHVWAATHKD